LEEERQRFFLKNIFPFYPLLMIKVSNLSSPIVMRNSACHLLLIAIFFALSCNTSYKAENVHYSHYKVQPSSVETKSLTPILKPYSDSINKLMNVVIGYNESPLEKKRQQNTLGFFMTDAFLEMARQKVDAKVDAAFMNAGGIRLPDLAAGAVTQGKVYELMPFDNLMVLLKVKGSLLKEYLDTLAANDGVIESGITMQIVNKTAQQVMIGGKSLDLNAEYIIAHSDYVASNSSLLKGIHRNTNGYLLRDAILDYIKLNHSMGKKITVVNTDRISYVN
jgi:2',3'-cyclic-nucleotide 2'-phosphodiesterase (5'-nucleotidase family)